MAQQGIPQIQMLEDSVRNRGEVHTDNETEQTPFLGHSPQTSSAGSRSKLRRTCCVKSKAATAILCWNLLMAYVIGYVNQIPSLTISSQSESPIPGINLKEYVPILYGLFALVYVFYPLAGCLADVKYGRYKTVICSLSFTAVSSSITTIISSIIVYYCSNLNNTNMSTQRVGVIIGSELLQQWHGW